TIVEHLGGSPLIAAAGVTSDPSPAYRTLVRWLKVIYGQADAVVKELLGDDFHKQFQGGMDMVRPFLERFDAITTKEMLPALGDGELALVVDAKWSSKNWFPGLDQHGESLPFIELGAVRTVKDSAQLLK